MKTYRLTIFDKLRRMRRNKIRPILYKKLKGCWHVINYKSQYPRIVINQKTCLLSRLVYEYYKGTLDEGMQACHSCDNTQCINPAHLFAGTQKDNNLDMIRKGRSPVIARKGVEHYNVKLTEDQVRHIWSLEGKFDMAKLAREYGVSREQIRRIKNKMDWRHLEETENALH